MKVYLTDCSHSNSQFPSLRLVSSKFVLVQIEEDSIFPLFMPRYDTFAKGKVSVCFACDQENLVSIHVQAVLEILAVDHECPVFTHQHCRLLVTHTHFAGIQKNSNCGPKRV